MWCGDDGSGSGGNNDYDDGRVTMMMIMALVMPEGTA